MAQWLKAATLTRGFGHGPKGREHSKQHQEQGQRSPQPPSWGGRRKAPPSGRSTGVVYGLTRGMHSVHRCVCRCWRAGASAPMCSCQICPVGCSYLFPSQTFPNSHTFPFQATQLLLPSGAGLGVGVGVGVGWGVWVQVPTIPPPPSHPPTHPPTHPQAQMLCKTLRNFWELYPDLWVIKMLRM